MALVSPRALFSQPSNLHEELVYSIARRIVTGDLSPGDIINVEDMMNGDRKVSRSSAREALRVLGTMGLVEARPRTGTRVRERKYWKLIDRDFLIFQFMENPDPSFVRSMFEVRRIIEPQAAALAAERATAADIKALRTAYAQMERATSDAQQWFDADFEFHRCLFAATKNVILEQFISVISITLLNAVRPPGHRFRPHGSSLEEHRAILDAICDKDPESAELATRHLINRALAPTRPRRKG